MTDLRLRYSQSVRNMQLYEQLPDFSIMTHTLSDKKELFELTAILKGIAIILVVAFHVFFALNDRLYYATCFYLRPFRMPVFMFVSGYLFAMISINKYTGFKQLAYDKFKRLLLPMLFLQIIVGAETFLIDLWKLNSTTIQNFSFSDFIIEALFYPQLSSNAYLWFVYVLFIVFLIAHVFRHHFLLFFGTGVALYFVDLPTIFDLSDLKFYLQYFALGALSFRTTRTAFQKIPSWIYLLAALICLYISSYYFRFTPLKQSDDSVYYLIRSYAGLMFILSFAILLQRSLKMPARLLANIGGYSASIYFLHIPFYHLVSMYLLKSENVFSGVELWAYIAITITVGIAGPISVDKYLISKSHLAGMLLLGRKSEFQLKEWLLILRNKMLIISK